MKKSKKINKLFIIIPTVISLSFAVYFTMNAVFSPYWDSVYPPDGYISLNGMSIAESSDTIYTNQQACDDLDYIVKCLKRVHPRFIDGVPNDIQNLLDSEKSSFSDEVSTLELWRSAARLLAAVGDSHNIIAPSFSRLYLPDYISKTEVGYSVEAINGVDLYTVFEKNKALFSYELEPWGLKAFTNCLQTKEGLEFIGIETNKIDFTYLSPEGVKETVTYTEDDFADYDTTASVLTVETSDYPDYSYDICKDDNLAVFTLNQCTYDSEFKEEVYNFFTEVLEENIKNVAIDLRNNSGGNSEVADEFILYLDRESVKRAGGYWRLGPYTMTWDARKEEISHYDDKLFDGNVFVMTSTNTFSSATLFAETIQDNGFGTVVGEVCGNMPAGFGDVVVFQTPNSLLTFQISSKYFERIDTSKADEPLTPDIQCPASDALNVIKNYK